MAPNSRTIAGYQPQRYRHRPTDVEGITYDGTRECAEAIVAWGRRRSQLGSPFVLAGNVLHAMTPEGTRPVPVGHTALIGVVGEPYSIAPSVKALAYVSLNGPDYRAPITAERARELVVEAQATSDRDRLRSIVAELGAQCELLLG